MSSHDETAHLLVALDEFNAAWANRDLAGLLSQFVPDDDVVLIGSENGELAHGPEELRRLLTHFFEQPVTYSWEWRRRDVVVVGEIAWIAAEGPIVEAGPEAEARIEYCVTGVLERRDGRWLWRLFHGSAPDASHVRWNSILRPQQAS